MSFASSCQKSRFLRVSVGPGDEAVGTPVIECWSPPADCCRNTASAELMIPGGSRTAVVVQVPASEIGIAGRDAGIGEDKVTPAVSPRSAAQMSAQRSKRSRYVVVILAWTHSRTTAGARGGHGSSCTFRRKNEIEVIRSRTALKSASFAGSFAGKVVCKTENQEQFQMIN